MFTTPIGQLSVNLSPKRHILLLGLNLLYDKDDYSPLTANRFWQFRQKFRVPSASDSLVSRNYHPLSLWTKLRDPVIQSNHIWYSIDGQFGVAIATLPFWQFSF